MSSVRGREQTVSACPRDASKVHGVAYDRTGHAVAAATSSTQLRAIDGNDLDALLAQLGIGRNVPVVADDDARRERHHVISVVPLLPLLLEDVPPCGHHAQRFKAQRIADNI